MIDQQAEGAAEAGDGIRAAGEKAWRLLQDKRLPASPRNYEIFFSYVTGANASLCERLAPRLARGEALSAAFLETVWLDHLHGEDIADAVGASADAIATTAHGIVAQIAGNRGQLLGYGRALAHWAERLAADPTAESLMQAVSALVAETTRAGERNRVLEQELVASADQISRLRQDLVATRQEASTDALTGIANRKAFDARLLRAMEQARAEPSRVFALLLIDIDHFKRFNDQHGHQTGDRVLRLVAQLLADNVKGRDTAARYGGEEFAIVLDGADRAVAVTVAEQLRERLAQRRLVKRGTGEPVGQVTCSIGVAQYRAGESGPALVERADRALYEAKRTGRDRVCAAS